jgi:predicted nucleic acid-binding protein
MVNLHTHCCFRSPPGKKEESRQECVRETMAALAKRRAPLLAVSPIVGGRAVKGPAAKILGVLGLASVTVEDVPTVHLAIRMLEQGVDFADALHLASSEGAERFVTFDAQLVKRAPKMSPLPVALA